MLFLPLRWLYPRWWRAVGDAAQRSFEACVLLCTPKIHFVVDDNLRETSKDGSQGPTLVVCNHQIDTDWIIAAFLAHSYSPGCLKIVMKEAIKAVPVMGWSGKLFGQIFVARKWEVDRPNLDSQLQNLLTYMASPLWLLIYPEGTTIHREAVAKSRAFAAEALPPRPQLSNVLLPRKTGSVFALSTMAEAAKRSKSGRPRVLDVTLAYAGYRGEIPSWDQGYARHKDVEVPGVPELCSHPFFGPGFSVHISMRELWLDDAEMQSGAWLDACWQQKDRLLEAFKSRQEFPQSDGESCRLRRRTWTAAASCRDLVEFSLPLLGPAVLFGAALRSRLSRPK